MNIAQIEINLQNLIKSFNKQTFIYQLLLAYGLPKASITRLQKGNLNLSKVEGEISWKKKLFFKEEYNQDLHITVSEITKSIKHNERFVIVTDYNTLLAIDTKTKGKLDIDLTDLPKHYDFFLPWAGMEKAQHQDENPADVKAAEKMAKLFDEIKKTNTDDSPEFIHGLNVFLSRLLFCFFAEDTHIFNENQFTNAIDSHTQKDGSDLNTYLDTLFEVLNTDEKDRHNLPDYLLTFPYVNGGLFKDNYKSPVFTRHSRQAILNSGDQNWSAINPDIFGSMFQAVISTDQRGSLGQHYTSVPNIMKVIEPLFLNDLYEEFEKANGNQKKLNALLKRIHNIKIFDPACGSGNFLIIAYKELRILEMKILKELKTITGTVGSGSLDFGNDYLSHISLSNFYGIEIDDFAHEIAKLALWLAEHQMNVEFFKEFGSTNPTLPLKEAGKIVQGNATRLDWERVCPKTKDSEIYILGNPPYLGSRKQKYEQKSDLAFVFEHFKKYKDLDYILCWFYLGAKYINGSNSNLAFVSTNSICQGLQVGMFWPHIFNKDIKINFAYKSFKWSNNAKDKAAVTVIIVGLKNSSEIKSCKIFSGNTQLSVKSINAYLTSGDNNVFVQSITKPISELPKINHGNMPAEGGKFLFNTQEKNDFIIEEPDSKKWFKPILSAREYLNGRERWCLWLEDISQSEIQKLPLLKRRVEDVKKIRLNSSRPELASNPHLFAQITQPKDVGCVIIPRVSSERRKHLPIGYIDGSIYKVTDSLFTVATNDIYILGIISSQLHTIWLNAIGGKMKTDYQYSKNVVYNTFPFPPISTQRKNEITQAVFRILEEREKHPEKTLAQLYDPDKMPDGLREAHRQNDEIIEKCYRSTPFKSDEERLEYLFKLYEKMIAEEKEQGTLFAKEKKTRKKRS